MKIDLTVLSKYKKVAIKCENEYEAKQLVEAMWREYPDKMKPWWRPHEVGFELGQEDHYAPHIYDNYVSCLQVADEHYWNSQGYTIIPFSILEQRMVDYGEFEAAGSPFSMFYGG